ncbi:hypothetical protein Ga0100230_022335 [Opitutaceae bacterium TAV3]|nr:hypothetical protein Ga0100230_022335 [Opitutaceae bacterium TAV3]
MLTFDTNGKPHGYQNHEIAQFNDPPKKRLRLDNRQRAFEGPSRSFIQDIPFPPQAGHIDHRLAAPKPKQTNQPRMDANER